MNKLGSTFLKCEIKLNFSWKKNFKVLRCIHTRGRCTKSVCLGMEQVRYSDVVLPDGYPIHKLSKNAAFSSMCDFTEKYIELTKLSCVLNFCSECPGALSLLKKWTMRMIWIFHLFDFNQHKNISSCSLHKQLLTKNGKTCASCMNIENINKVKVTTRKIIALKLCRILYFHSEYYIPEI